MSVRPRAVVIWSNQGLGFVEVGGCVCLTD
ncbi:unnamed protein product, partial [Didymodactylos carnosus]